MGKQKDKPPEPEGDPTGDTAPVPELPKDDLADRVKSILAGLAESGEIIGTEPSPPGSAPGKPEAGPPDLEAAVARVLERRDAEGKAREKEQERETALTDLKARVDKGLGRVRRWFEPASPWGE